MVAARSLDYYSKLAKQRQIRKPKSVQANSPEQKKCQARDEAGALLGVSGRSVEHATALDTAAGGGGTRGGERDS